MSVFRDPRFHWELCRNVEASYQYCKKSEGRINGPWSDEEVILPPEIYGWQQKLVDLIPDMKFRHVNWFWEPIGGIGKSTLVRYLAITRRKEVILVSGKDGDMKYGVYSFLKNHKKGPSIVMVDVPRSNKEFLSYGGIEQIANGCFFSSKYESDMIVTRYPLVICFANSEPDYEKMSADRWQVYEILAESGSLKKKVFAEPGRAPQPEQWKRMRDELRREDSE